MSRSLFPFLFALFLSPLARADEVAAPDTALTIHASPRPLAKEAVVADWPRLLGPSHDNTTTESPLLVDWGDGGPKLLWERRAGGGYSPPTVVGERVLFFHTRGDEALLECLAAETGRCLWSFTYPSGYRDRFGFSNGPRGPAVVEDGRVFLHGAEGVLHALDLATGKVLWKRDTSKENAVPQDYFGVAASPLVLGSRVIVNVGAPGGPCVVAFDAASGEVLWTAGKEWGPGCATPVPATIHGKEWVFLFTGGDSRPPTGGLLVLDPATGKIGGSFPFRSDDYYSVNASSPVVLGDRIYISSSYETGGVMLRLETTGALSEVYRTADLGCHFMTPVAKDGFLYGIDGMKAATLGLVCLDLATGKKRWKVNPELAEEMDVNGERRLVPFGIDHASLVRAGDRFLCLGEQGHLLWLELSPDNPRILARTRLFAARETWGPLVVSHGLLYVRQNSKDPVSKKPTRLLCYDLRGE